MKPHSYSHIKPKPQHTATCFRSGLGVNLSLAVLLLLTLLLARSSTAAPVELLVNGSFETGTFTGWTAAVNPNRPFFPWAVSRTGGSGYGLATVSPQDGNYAAWNGFDGSGPLEFTLKQRISLPTNHTVTLSWKHRAQWDFSLGAIATQPRMLLVELLAPQTSIVVTQVYSFSTGTQAESISGDTGWVSLSADLSSFAGSDFDLQFREVIPQLSTGPGQIEFDAISVKSELADRDGDGIPDDQDQCPDSDLRSTVFVEDCDSGVANQLFANGCTISDLIGEGSLEVRNHGEFVSQVANTLNELKRASLISGADKGAIQNCAAKSTIGQYPRPENQ